MAIVDWEVTRREVTTCWSSCLARVSSQSLRSRLSHHHPQCGWSGSHDHTLAAYNLWHGGGSTCTFHSWSSAQATMKPLSKLMLECSFAFYPHLRVAYQHQRTVEALSAGRTSCLNTTWCYLYSPTRDSPPSSCFRLKGDLSLFDLGGANQVRWAPWSYYSTIQIRGSHIQADGKFIVLVPTNCPTSVDFDY